jgi:tRNA G10  N-methylase Trm11
MINNYQFLYKLGHCPEICAEEFLVLTKSKPEEIMVSGNYLFSNKEVNVNLSGGLVFGAKILKQFDFNKENKVKVIEEIENILIDGQESGQYKKTGFSLDFAYDLTRLLKITKKYSVKNTVLITEKTPNIGNWKSMKNWIVQIKILDTTIIFKINSYFNQEKWAKIDSTLPKGDMKRGIINLKLARILNNLTINPNIWDPFCGSGRNLVSAIDIKKQFYLSDSAQVCIEDEVPANFNYILTQFKNEEIETAKLVSSFVADAGEFKNPCIEGEDLAIVTEGWLGTNLHGNKVNIELVKKDFQFLAKTWRTIIYKASQSKQVSDIIFCLPYHINWPEESQKLLESIYKWLENTNYTIQFPPVIYSREKSNVGHAIIHLK